MKFQTDWCKLEMDETAVQAAIEANAVGELHEVIKLLRQFEKKWVTGETLTS